MDGKTLNIDDLLKSVTEQYKSAVNEIKQKFQDSLEWLTEIGEAIEKHTCKSTFLLPKTPTASRKLRKRAHPPCIPEFDEATSSSRDDSTCSSRSSGLSYSTRNTRRIRSTRQNTVKLSPVLSTRLTRTKSKATSKKIRQTELSIIEKTDCSSDVVERQDKHTSVDEVGEKECPSKATSKKIRQQTEFIIEKSECSSDVGERQNKRTSVDEVGEKECPSKVRKATSKKIRQQTELGISEKTECSSDVGERQNKRTSVDEIGERECPSKVRKVDMPKSFVLVEKLEISTATIESADSNSVEDVISTEATDDSKSKQDVNVQFNSMFPLVERLRPSCISSASNNITEEEESTHEITSSTEVSQAERDERKKSDHQNTDETLPTSTVTGEISEEEISSVPLNATITLSKNKPIKSSTQSSHSIDSSVDEESPKPGKEQLEPITNSTLDDSVMSPANLTINDISDSEEHENESEEIVPVEKNHEIEFCSVGAMEQTKCVTKLSNIKLAVPSTPKKVPKSQEQSQKSTIVFSPYANEPVRERVAAFERLQTVSEEPVKKSPLKEVQQPPMRVTRTKTRAMAAAEAAAAAASTTESSGTSVIANVPQDSNSKKQLSENAWKASRKSLAKAKRICTSKEKRQNPSPEEQEISKENSILHSASKYHFPYGASSASKYRNTPLSSSNISNTSMNSVNRIYTVGSASKQFTKKNSGNIVVGVESFLTKKTTKHTYDERLEMKEVAIRRREEKAEEIRKQREQYMKEKIEEKKRLREAKMMKVFKTREALEKQKQDQELLLQKEKAEKLKEILQERDEKMKEHMQQKKQHAFQKAAEIEERRKQEEAARLARRKEQEEEQRRQQAVRIKEQEEAERHYQKRLAEEKQAMIMQQMQAKLVNEKQKEKTEIKPKTAPAKPVMDKTFEVPQSSKNQLKKIPNINDYGIDSASGDSSSEDEDKPKKSIPLWARREERNPVLKKSVFKEKKIYEAFYTCDNSPDVMSLFRHFGIKQRVRTSSAVWRTPPRYSTLPKF